MLRTLREADARSCWDEWEQLASPALVVRAGSCPLPPADAHAMVRRGRGAQLVELADAELADAGTTAPRSARAVARGAEPSSPSVMLSAPRVAARAARTTAVHPDVPGRDTTCLYA
jgi:hypothetical protein